MSNDIRQRKTTWKKYTRSVASNDTQHPKSIQTVLCIFGANSAIQLNRTSKFAVAWQITYFLADKYNSDTNVFYSCSSSCRSPFSVLVVLILCLMFQWCVYFFLSFSLAVMCWYHFVFVGCLLLWLFRAVLIVIYLLAFHLQQILNILYVFVCLWYVCVCV